MPELRLASGERRTRQDVMITWIAALELPPKKRAALRAILDDALTDAVHTLLLAIDGEASLGGVQMPYSLRDENGRELTGGQLEVEAWKRFHGPPATSRRRR
jgi:hypothetical protein